MKKLQNNLNILCTQLCIDITFWSHQKRPSRCGCYRLAAGSRDSICSRSPDLRPCVGEIWHSGATSSCLLAEWQALLDRAAALAICFATGIGAGLLGRTVYSLSSSVSKELVQRKFFDAILTRPLYKPEAFLGTRLFFF